MAFCGISLSRSLLGVKRTWLVAAHMSAFDPKRTCASALQMSAFGVKADMTVSGYPLSRSLLGVKRTCPFALQMSAYDPKRTSSSLTTYRGPVVHGTPTSLGNPEIARLSYQPGSAGTCRSGLRCRRLPSVHQTLRAIDPGQRLRIGLACNDSLRLPRFAGGEPSH